MINTIPLLLYLILISVILVVSLIWLTWVIRKNKRKEKENKYLVFFKDIIEDIKSWLKIESNFVNENMVDFVKLLISLDFKSSLVVKNEGEEEPVAISMFSSLKNYNTILNRLLSLDMYLKLKYGIEVIEKLKRDVLELVYSYRDIYGEIFPTKKDIEDIIQSHEYIWYIIFVQICLVTDEEYFKYLLQRYKK